MIPRSDIGPPSSGGQKQTDAKPCGSHGAWRTPRRSQLTDDLEASEAWYSKLLGRGPDYRPMETMVEWELFDRGGLIVSSDDVVAGHGALFLIVDDVAAERSRLKAIGIELGNDLKGDYSTLAQTLDPDGNLIILATPPSPSYPPA